MEAGADHEYPLRRYSRGRRGRWPRRAASSAEEGVTATDRSIASGRDTNIEGDVYLGQSPAEVEAIIQRTLRARICRTWSGKRRVARPGDRARVRDLSAALDLRGRRWPECSRSSSVSMCRRAPAEVLAEIAARHQSLLERVRLLDARSRVLPSFATPRPRDQDGRV